MNEKIFAQRNGHMVERLLNLYKEIDTILNNAPCMEDCADEDNAVYSDMANLKESLFDAGYDWQKER